MYRKRHKRGKRLASVFLTVALITATVPVQAAEFGTPDSFEEIFSSGEEDSCITDAENTLPAASDSEKVMASELSPTPTVTSTPEGTPMPSSTPTPSVTPSPSPTPTINPEKEVMLRFIDGEGNECEQLRTVMSWGESLILPNVPDTGAPDMWKLEKNEKLGKKLFITGKGRCNLTNNCEVEELMKHVVTNPKFLYSAFYNCNAQDVMQFFEQNGLELKTERGNRVFPASDHSSDVIKTLEQALNKRKVTVRLHHTVTRILTEPVHDRMQNQMRVTGICVKDEKGLQKQEHFDAVIVATGGLSYERTGSTGDGLQFARDLGLQVTECQPSLVPFEIEEDFCRNLMGLSLRNVTLSCYTKKKNKDKLLYQEQGEMLFTHFGISGPLVLSASAYTGKAKGEPIWVEIDLKPALTIEQLDARILRDFDAAKNKQVRNALDELLPKKLIPVMIELAEIDPFKQVNTVTKEERERLIACMKKLTLHVVGTRGYEEAIITRGGVSVKEINPKTMEAKQIPGLYFIGEVLDVDALTGGFNLQIAWATAATVLLSE